MSEWTDSTAPNWMSAQLVRMIVMWTLNASILKAVTSASAERVIKEMVTSAVVCPFFSWKKREFINKCWFLAICDPDCLNGGICTKPGQCSCPGGYTGVSCEKDLDECATNAHRCTNSSICVNEVGWYYCQCKPGYHGPIFDTNLGTSCVGT